MTKKEFILRNCNIVNNGSKYELDMKGIFGYFAPVYRGYSVDDCINDFYSDVQFGEFDDEPIIIAILDRIGWDELEDDIYAGKKLSKRQVLKLTMSQCGYLSMGSSSDEKAFISFYEKYMNAMEKWGYIKNE